MTREIVIDGCVSAAWFFTTEQTQTSLRILQEALNQRLRIVVPELWRYEMLNILPAAVARKLMTRRDALRSLLMLRNIPVEVVSAESQGQGGILSAALQLRLSVYRATYIHLAESRGVDLVTADDELLRFQPQFSWIKSVEQFTKDLAELGEAE